MEQTTKNTKFRPTTTKKIEEFSPLSMENTRGDEKLAQALNGGDLRNAEKKVYGVEQRMEGRTRWGLNVFDLVH